MNARIHPERVPVAPTESEDGYSLPAWIYRDPEFFELEQQTIFRSSWQLVCHVNDIPKDMQR